jgi:hypothetical protein
MDVVFAPGEHTVQWDMKMGGPAYTLGWMEKHINKMTPNEIGVLFHRETLWNDST